LDAGPETGYFAGILRGLAQEDAGVDGLELCPGGGISGLLRADLRGAVSCTRSHETPPVCGIFAAALSG
jgi:hypothetical protein